MASETVPQDMGALSPTLLTPGEAAIIARCSIKTVRRAYATGALPAYRRGGSRAVLLDSQDVLAWVRGQIVQPPGRTTPPPEPRFARPARRVASRAETSGRPPKLGSRQRFDLSADALRDRRNLNKESLP